MSKLPFSLALLTFSASSAFAVEKDFVKSASESRVSYTAGATVASSNVASGKTLNRNPVFQPSLEAKVKNVTVSAAGSFASEKLESEDFGNEVDLSLGYSQPVGIAKISAALTHAMYPGYEAENKPAQSLGLGVALNTILNPTLKMSAGLDKENQGSFSYSAAVSEDVYTQGRFAANLAAKLGYSDKKNGPDGFKHLTLTSGVDYADLSATVNYVVETDSKVNDLDGQVKLYATIGTKHSF